MPRPPRNSGTTSYPESKTRLPLREPGLRSNGAPSGMSGLASQARPLRRLRRLARSAANGSRRWLRSAPYRVRIPALSSKKARFPCGNRACVRMVPPAGFEPAISTLKGWRPRPLDDGDSRGKYSREIQLEKTAQKTAATSDDKMIPNTASPRWGGIHGRPQLLARWQHDSSDRHSWNMLPYASLWFVRDA